VTSHLPRKCRPDLIVSPYKVWRANGCLGSFCVFAQTRSFSEIRAPGFNFRFQEKEDTLFRNLPTDRGKRDVKAFRRRAARA
jgi:hypothetical protein